MQSECRKQIRAGGRLECRQRAYRPIPNHQHMDGMRVPPLVITGLLVDGEGRLAIRSDGHESDAAARLPRYFEERPDGAAPPVPLQPWRHGKGRILREKRDECVHIVLFPSRKIAVKQLLLLSVRSWHSKRAAIGIMLRERLTSPLECAVDRSCRAAE